MKKTILAITLFVGVSISGFAQTDKMKETANEKVEALNTEIIAGDISQALSDEQKTQIYTIHIERLIELRQAKKDGADKEANKVINKKYFKKIFQEVLTKEQMKARKAAKEKSKQ
ncbi:hypothetical protein [Seonamhaeicola maritimus]|uniref:DUF4890 domain-containing protein n=1 Tax=Seonamhaeicola maritimus TaxID=2591822 RepID=A0A5C7GGI2_9FLAO|nr:hypothetical protein [Seonamhaeicola maritimus]TXG36064.1 hypothetical protein FUA22_13320 [Seonamhaeicola maritimus]